MADPDGVRCFVRSMSPFVVVDSHGNEYRPEGYSRYSTICVGWHGTLRNGVFHADA